MRRPQYGSPEYTARWFARFPHLRGLGADAGRQQLQRDAGDMLTARANGSPPCPVSWCRWPQALHDHSEPEWKG